VATYGRVRAEKVSLSNRAFFFCFGFFFSGTFFDVFFSRKRRRLNRFREPAQTAPFPKPKPVDGHFQSLVFPFSALTAAAAAADTTLSLSVLPLPNFFFTVHWAAAAVQCVCHPRKLNGKRPIWRGALDDRRVSTQRRRSKGDAAAKSSASFQLAPPSPPLSRKGPVCCVFCLCQVGRTRFLCFVPLGWPRLMALPQPNPGSRFGLLSRGCLHHLTGKWRHFGAGWGPRASRLARLLLPVSRFFFCCWLAVGLSPWLGASPILLAALSKGASPTQEPRAINRCL
jgi:hypothetical protein